MDKVRWALPLRAALLLLLLAATAASCGVVSPATGPPTYGNGQSHGHA